MADALELFAACAPGLEPLLADEVRQLGVEPLAVAGGVVARGDLALVYRANLRLGLALKVLVRLGSFRATRFDQLVSRAQALDWTPWLTRHTRTRLRVTCRKSRLYHSGAVGERVRQAIARRLGDAPVATADDPDGVDVHVRLDADRCEISIDTSGAPLPKRGYRLASGKAPLREDLARAALIVSGWDRQGPLVDPFCGAGTLLIEAGLLASGRAPGRDRRFAFMAAPGFDATQWRRELEATPPGTELPPLRGSDRDADAIAAAEANAARAGIPLELTQAPLSTSPVFGAPQPGGALVTNPPYGKRLGAPARLERLYAALGGRIRTLPRDWRVGLVCPSLRLARATGVALTSALMTDHGGGKIYVATRAA